MNTPQIGTVVSDTLLTEDLIDAFSSEYEWITGDEWPIEERDEEELEELFNALNKLAPEGCYFGAHPGDGADFGFWPIED